MEARIVTRLVDEGEWVSLRTAIEQSIDWLKKQRPNRRLTFGPRVLTATELIAALTRVLILLIDDPSPALFAERLSAEFEVYESIGGEQRQVLVTGYYAPEILANHEQTEEYHWPIYGRPPDLVTVKLGRFKHDLRGRQIIGRVVDGDLRPYLKRAGNSRTGRFHGAGSCMESRPGRCVLS